MRVKDMIYFILIEELRVQKYIDVALFKFSRCYNIFNFLQKDLYVHEKKTILLK